MESAQGIVLGSPVYLSSVAPEMMSLLARATFVAHWNNKFLAGKVGGPITVARRAGHNLAFSQLLLWFFINGITVPGSTYWTVGMAGRAGPTTPTRTPRACSTWPISPKTWQR